MRYEVNLHEHTVLPLCSSLHSTILLVLALHSYHINVAEWMIIYFVLLIQISALAALSWSCAMFTFTSSNIPTFYKQVLTV